MHNFALLLQDAPNAAAIQHLMMVVLAIIPIIYAVIVAIVMVPCWFILKKAGFSPWLSLMCLIPSLGTLVLLYVLAFADWKIAPVAPPGLQPEPPFPPQA